MTVFLARGTCAVWQIFELCSGKTASEAFRRRRRAHLAAERPHCEHARPGKKWSPLRTRDQQARCQRGSCVSWHSAALGPRRHRTALATASPRWLSMLLASSSHYLFAAGLQAPLPRWHVRARDFSSRHVRGIIELRSLRKQLRTRVLATTKP